MNLAAMSVFEFANTATGSKHYDIQILSENGGAVESSLGVSVNTQPIYQTDFDTLIVGGRPGFAEVSPLLADYMRTAFKTTRRMAAICTGAFVLAEAGILDGRSVTTHWLATQHFKERFPHITMEEGRIFVVDGSVWTSAGMSAGIDMALGMLEKDLGAEVAYLVAKQLIVYHRRAGGQPQHSTLLDLTPKSDRIQSVLSYASRNLRLPLSIHELAREAHLSPRQFTRTFRTETGQSPAKAIENLRVEAAKLMIEQGRHTIEMIAEETGFASLERMRRAFVRAYGQPPQTLRRNARNQI